MVVDADHHVREVLDRVDVVGLTVPFGLQHLAERSSATSLKVVSPERSQLWLEADGGAWINPSITPRTFDAGTDVLVDVGLGNVGFVLLTAERELRFADCSL